MCPTTFNFFAVFVFIFLLKIEVRSLRVLLVLQLLYYTTSTRTMILLRTYKYKYYDTTIIDSNTVVQLFALLSTIYQVHYSYHSTTTTVVSASNGTEEARTHESSPVIFRPRSCFFYWFDENWLLQHVLLIVLSYLPYTRSEV